MPLNFPGVWRFNPPADGTFNNSTIPQLAVAEFGDVIDKLRNDKSRWWMYEHFKNSFGCASRSSSESWALTDLYNALDSAAGNAPLFIESFYDACEDLRQQSDQWFVPEVSLFNAILARHNVGYEIQPPDLVPRELSGSPIVVAEVPASFAEQAREIMDRSLKRSEELLSEGHPREAVQEVLWLLETVSTAYRGIEMQSGKIEGAYFNKIVGDLQKKLPGTTLTTVLSWITSMHGYLSAPAGGGVRHGIDLNRSVELDQNQARLFCNLTRSYISFLIVEHASVSKTRFP
jgi:hypothetical protein